MNYFKGLLLVFFILGTHFTFSQSFDKEKRDKEYKKGKNIEYYKNGVIKSVSEYKRKIFWYYTDTYWTIKEYDMSGNQTRLIKKVTQMARRENAERIVKEEVYIYDPKKENKPKETIRPE
ncbi:MAG TPA: hypothetical protein VK766_10555 [Cytophagaceae bacterium]|nr:hypothetical protein [Cytophagaceae bacterium]